MACARVTQEIGAEWRDTPFLSVIICTAHPHTAGCWPVIEEWAVPVLKEPGPDDLRAQPPDGRVPVL